jgi:hypothetical protein
MVSWCTQSERGENGGLGCLNTCEAAQACGEPGNRENDDESTHETLFWGWHCGGIVWAAWRVAGRDRWMSRGNGAGESTRTPEGKEQGRREVIGSPRARIVDARIVWWHRGDRGYTI